MLCMCRCTPHRQMVYPQTDVVLVTFSILNPTSFENVKEKVRSSCPPIFRIPRPPVINMPIIVWQPKRSQSSSIIADMIPHSLMITTACTGMCMCCQWVPEVRHHCPKIPIIIVGLHIDMRYNDDWISKVRPRLFALTCAKVSSQSDVGATISVTLVPAFWLSARQCPYMPYSIVG